MTSHNAREPVEAIPGDISMAAQAALDRMPDRRADMETGEFWARVEYEVVSAILAERQRDQWQPIETAPKDGTKILLCLTGYEPVVGFFDGANWDHQTSGDFAEEDHWLAWIEQTGVWNPDHWMPLPASPKKEAE